MASKILTSVSLILAPLLLSAQTAQEYFHGGAQHYIFGEKEKAMTEVKTGLQRFPNDPKLTSLAGLLKKEEKKQEQQKQQNKQDSDKNDQQKQEQQKQQQQSKPEQNPHDQADQNKAPNQKQNEQDQAKQDKPQGNAPGDEKEGEQTEANTGTTPGQMTIQEAQQLLDSHKGQERAMIFVPAQKLKDAKRVFKDW